MFGKATQKAVNTLAKKTANTALNKTGTYIGNKAGDKIVKLLQVNPVNVAKKSTINENTPLTDYEVNERVQRLLSGSGKIRKLRI